MQDFTFIDETLDINLTQSYLLSIQANLNGLSFCILDPLRNKYLALVHKNISRDLIFDDYLNEIEAFAENTELLNQHYKSTKFIWTSTKNTLIPNELFEKNQLKKHFEFNQNLDELDEIHYFKLKYIPATSVFIVPSQVANIFIRQFPKIQFLNQQIPFIDHSSIKQHSDGKNVFVDVNENFIDINIVENGKLLFYNNFMVKTDLDLVYYVLNTFNQFKLDPNTIELVLSGFIDKKSTAYKKLKEFIHHVKFNKLPEDFSYSYTFNEIPHHTYINLYNLNHCE